MHAIYPAVNIKELTSFIGAGKFKPFPHNEILRAKWLIIGGVVGTAFTITFKNEDDSTVTLPVTGGQVLPVSTDEITATTAATVFGAFESGSQKAAIVNTNQ